jgi:beta-glucosidase/6-phospho-beta-glucosidase/beta-galactosidase
MRFIGAFESTYLPAHDVDIVETSGHARRWREDLALLRRHGVTRLRYPIRWHRVEAEPGVYDWRHTDEVMGHLHAEGFEPIVDLVHHTSYPRWLEGFADPRFGPAYERFCTAFAERYPWIPGYTLFNEPFATLFLAGHEGIWAPYHRAMPGLIGLMDNVLPAIGRAARAVAERLPDAQHVWFDSCEGHVGVDAAGEAHAHMANDRRFFVLDALTGRAGDRARPFVAAVAQAGGEALLELEPIRIDTLGLDYYAHHEWAYTEGRGGGIQGAAPGPEPQGLARLILQYGAHAGLPLMLGETNLAGAPYDRATWLKHTLEQCEAATALGHPIDAYCWFGFLDSLDWNSLLQEAARSIDPVGVIWLDENLDRRESSMSRAYTAAAAGARAAELPAYRLSDGTARWLRGLLPLMSHFDWSDPPPDEVASYARGRLTAMEVAA